MKTEVVIVYKIYVIKNGLLVEPKTWDYERNLFDEYNSQDSALEAISRENKYPSEYVILPVTAIKYIYDED